LTNISNRDIIRVSKGKKENKMISIYTNNVQIILTYQESYMDDKPFRFSMPKAVNMNVNEFVDAQKWEIANTLDPLHDGLKYHEYLALYPTLKSWNEIVLGMKGQKELSQADKNKLNFIKEALKIPMVYKYVDFINAYDDMKNSK
jgi:hypothetical protein